MKKPKPKVEEKVKAYEFTVHTVGHGATPEEAWAGACEHILDDFDGFSSVKDLPDYKVIEED